MWTDTYYVLQFKLFLSVNADNVNKYIKKINNVYLRRVLYTLCVISTFLKIIKTKYLKHSSSFRGDLTSFCAINLSGQIVGRNFDLLTIFQIF